MLVATCTSLQHSSTKHYLTPQPPPPKSKQMPCLLGRTPHLNHPVKGLCKDTAGSKSGETITTEVPHKLQRIPPAAPHYCRQRDPHGMLGSLHTHTHTHKKGQRPTYRMQQQGSAQRRGLRNGTAFIETSCVRAGGACSASQTSRCQSNHPSEPWGKGA